LSTDIDDPNRKKLLKDAVEAKLMCAKTDKLLPSCNAEKALQLLPKRAIDLNDKDEPKLRKLNTESFEPNLIACLTLKEDPSATSSRIEILQHEPI
jgi:hypothetical protein